MSNFLEQNPLQLAPYRSLPVDLYGAIGMQEQSEYDEGAKRIQGAIDTVAGIDVSRDIDKQYLNQKVVDLTNQINGFKGVDWRNKSVLGQATSLASNIARDKNVQAAAYTTAKIKKSFADVEQAKKDGTYNASNENDLHDQINQYNKKGLGETQEISYTPYSDYNKKALEAIKAVDPDSKLVQEAGNNFDPIMVEKYYKGKDKDKILSAINTVLSPADYNQMQMDGRYQYKGINPQALYTQRVAPLYKQENDLLTSRQNELNAALLSTKDPEKRKAINSQLTDIGNRINTLPNKYSEIQKSAIENPDQFKGQVFTQQWLSNIQNAFSSSETYQKNLENPVYKAWFEQEKFRHDISRDYVKDAQWEREFGLKNNEFDLKKAEFAFKMKKAGLTENGVPDRQTAPVKTTDDPTYYSTQFNNEYVATVNDRDGLAMDLYTKMALLNPSNTNLTPEQIKQNINNVAKQNGETPEAFANRGLQTYINTYKSNNRALPFDIQKDVDKYNTINQDVELKHSIISKADEIVKQKIGDKAFNTFNNYNNSIPDNVPVTILSTDVFNPDRKNTKLSLSREDLINLANATVNNKYITENKVPKDIAKDSRAKLVNKYGEDVVSKLEDKLEYLDTYHPTENINPAAAIAIQKTGGYSDIALSGAMKNLYSILGKSDIQKGYQAKEEYFRNTGKVAEPFNSPIYRGDAETKDNINTKIMSLTGMTTIAGGNESKTFDREKFNKALLEDGSTLHLRVEPPAGEHGQYTFKLQVERKEGDTREMTISKEQAESLTGDKYTYNDSPMAKRLQYSPNNTSNYVYGAHHPNSYQTAGYSHKEFKKVSGYTVAGDVVKNSDGLYNFVIHVKDPKTGDFVDYTLERDYPLNVAEKIPETLTDDNISELIKKHNQ